MKILSYNPGHDGAFSYLEDGHLVFSIEAEKSSKYRHSSLSLPDVFDTLAELQAAPDVLCKGGWWPGESPHGGEAAAEYHGSDYQQVIVGKKYFLGNAIDFFSSSHERSHLLCAFGMSNLPKGTGRGRREVRGLVRHPIDKFAHGGVGQPSSLVRYQRQALAREVIDHRQEPWELRVGRLLVNSVYGIALPKRLISPLLFRSEAEMSKSDARFYRRREAQELKASTIAADPRIGRLHWEMAQRYADMAEQAEEAPSIRFVPDCGHLPD